MKGGRMPPPGHHSRHISSSSRSSSRRSSSSSRYSSVHNARLEALGFDDSEVQLLLDDEYFAGITEQEIVDKYLEIAQNDPFNLNWDSDEDAMNSDYMIQGTQFSKHDIAKDTFNYFSQRGRQSHSQGLAEGIRKKKKGSRKHRTHKRKHSRRHRTRHRRRY